VFGIEFLKDNVPLKAQVSASDIHALALAMAVLQAKAVGANHIRLSDEDGMIIDDFAIGGDQSRS